MTTLAIVPSTGIGFREFRDEAFAWNDRHHGVVHVVDLARPLPARFREVVGAIEQHEPELVAFFCHGLARSLPQLGVSIATVATLAGALARATTAPRVALFSCLAGEDLISGPHGPPGGDGGLADQLRDALVKHGAVGAQVDAHGSSSQRSDRERDLGGHTTHNPYVRRFLGPELKDHPGGFFLVEPSSPAWDRWVRWLRTGLGWREFPLMSQAEIVEAWT